jgi:DNA-binding GntR family transcriptional regulator
MAADTGIGTRFSGEAEGTLPFREKPREMAYRRFTHHLLAAQIRPGQFVTQRELVALTGLPLGAIRELIPRLEADGLLETVPQRGMQIASVDLKLIRNAFQLRLIIERDAVAHFTETAPLDVIERLIESHRAVLRLARDRITRELLEQAQSIDWRLHDTMVDSLDNELVSSVYRVNSIKIRLIRLQYVLLTPQLLSPAMREHLTILAAMRRRDPGQAVRALERHLTHARSRVMGVPS